MKKNGDILFELIKSLSRNEKGYFVKFASSLPGRKAGRYLELFRAMADMESYDEEILQEQLKALHFPKQVHRIRHYLYSSILNSLEQYHKETNLTQKSFILLKQAHILTDRKLYEQSNILLDRAEKLVLRSANLHRKFEILHLRFRNQMNLNQSAIRWGGAQKIAEQMFETSLVQHQTIQSYKAYTGFLEYFHKYGKARNNKEKTRYTKLFNSLCNSIDKKYLNDWGKLDFYNAMSMYGSLIGNDEIASKGLARAHDILKGNASFIENQRNLPAVSYNLLNFYLSIKKFKKAEQELNDLSKWLAVNKKLLSNDIYDDIENTVYLQWFNLLLKNRQKIYNKSLFENIFSFFKGRKLRTLHQFKYLSNSVIYYLYEDHPAEALEYINTLMNESIFKNFDKDAFTEVELLNLFVHSKLGNSDLVQSLVVNLKRKIKNREILPFAGFAAKLLQQYSHFPLNGHSSELKQWTNNLIAELKKYYKENVEEMSQLDFNYPWYFENVFLKR